MSEVCHFCNQKVYLMEKISAENLVLHRSCLKCAHCHTNLRLGGYAFDRDSTDGFFYCTQHFRLPVKSMKVVSKQPRLMVRREFNELLNILLKLLFFLPLSTATNWTIVHNWSGSNRR